MRYFTTPGTGDGTTGNPFRPDVPAGTAYSGRPSDGHVPRWFLATPADLSAVPGCIEVTDLAAEASARGLALADVQKWKVSP